MDSVENVHKGHRERLKRKFINSNGVGLEPHEALELLLFYALPQKSTNELAHNLLKRFGGLAGVLDAEFEDLLDTGGIKEHTATLLKLQGYMVKAYLQSKREHHTLKLNSENAIEYIKNLFASEANEAFYAILLDTNYSVISAERISCGLKTSAALYPRDVVKRALAANATNVVLAHNHPNGDIAPSAEDIKTTVTIEKALSYLSINLLDHMIVAKDSCISIFNNIDKN